MLSLLFLMSAPVRGSCLWGLSVGLCLQSCGEPRLEWGGGNVIPWGWRRWRKEGSAVRTEALWREGYQRTGVGVTLTCWKRLYKCPEGARGV